MKFSVKELYYRGTHLYVDGKMVNKDFKIHLPYWKYIDKIAEFEFLGKKYNFYIDAENFYEPTLGFELFVLYRLLHNGSDAEYLCKNSISYYWKEGAKEICYHMPLIDILDFIEKDNEGYYYINI